MCEPANPRLIRAPQRCERLLLICVSSVLAGLGLVEKISGGRPAGVGYEARARKPLQWSVRVFAYIKLRELEDFLTSLNLISLHTERQKREREKIAAS